MSRLRVALLSASPDAYATRRLREVLGAMGHAAQVVDPTRLVLRLTEAPAILEDGEEVPPPDALIPRLMGPAVTWGAAVVSAWQARGVPCPTPPEAIARAHDKLATTLALVRAELPVVPTLALREPWHAEGALPALLPSASDTWVVKLPEGAAGLGVALAQGAGAARALAQLATARREVALVQPWVPTEPVRDLRVLVAGDEPIAAMTRLAPPGEFRANVHRGATAVAERTLSRAASELAVAAARAVGLPFCGVDLLETPDGLAVLEVNATPGFEGLERAVGQDLVTPFVTRWLTTPPAP